MFLGYAMFSNDHFFLILLQRNGKSSACNVVKVMDGNGTVRPERLLARLKINSVDETGPRLIVVRPPKGPDGSRGFAAQYRMPRIAGELDYEDSRWI